MKSLCTGLVLLLALLLIAGCASEPTPDVQATIAAAVAATQTAAPTNTPTPVPPTATPQPTDTPTPTQTPTPTNTPTPKPTATPKPTTPKPTEPPAAISGIIESKLENGDTLYELPAEGFSIALSEDWYVADLDKLNFPAVFDEMAQQNESLQGLFSSGFLKNMVASGMKFYALNLSQQSLKSAVPPNINILKQELPIKLTLDKYTSLSMSQLEQFFDLTSEIKQEDVMLGETKAAKISYTAKLIDPLGRTIELSNTQYLVVQDSLVYIVTLSVPIELAKKQMQPYTQTAETFRVLQ